MHYKMHIYFMAGLPAQSPSFRPSRYQWHTRMLAENKVMDFTAAGPLLLYTRFPFKSKRHHIKQVVTLRGMVIYVKVS